MADLRVELPPVELKNRDLKVTVFDDSRKLGEIRMSRGNIEWVPANHSVNQHRLTWKQFAALMEGEGKPVKLRRKTRTSE